MASLDQAKYNDIIHFAITSGLDASYQTKLEDARNMIRAAFGDNVDIPERKEVEAEQVVVTSSDGSASASYRHDPKVVVNIASDDQNGGKRHFPICVNGDHILVKRDTDVAIPYRHYLALKNARETVMRQEFDAASMRYRTFESEQYSVRFSVVDMPSKDEIDAFHERTKDLGREPAKAAA